MILVYSLNPMQQVASMKRYKYVLYQAIEYVFAYIFVLRGFLMTELKKRAY